jgi:hypothetical protein
VGISSGPGIYPGHGQKFVAKDAKVILRSTVGLTGIGGKKLMIETYRDNGF